MDSSQSGSASRCGTSVFSIAATSPTWCGGVQAEVEDIHGRVRVAAQACKERVIAEFRGLRMAWSVLRLERLEDLVNRPSPEKQQQMKKDIQMLASAFKLNDKILRHEFSEVARTALCQYAACGANRHGVHFDNKTVWSLFLDPDFIEKKFPARSAPFSELPTVLRIYIGILIFVCFPSLSS